jgi:uncharacterized heparinase superfamily protein
MGPPDLRAHDPSFADELAAGSFGLAGKVAHLNGRSPFSVHPPSEEWQRELQGFGWLRHLDPAASEDREVAHRFVGDWIRRYRRNTGLAWQPEIVARRITSWLGHADLALGAADQKHHSAFMRSLAHQVAFLSEAWRDTADGYPRLLALISLVQADLCIADRDQSLAQSQRLLAPELDRQIAPDGAHASRNPWTLVELLLDLLPLRRCFAACGVPPDPAIPAAIRRITAMLRHLCLGNDMPARFNGMGPGERGMLASVLAYDEARTPEPAVPERGGYVRLQRQSTIVLIDAASPARGELAQDACAGCLALEVSSGSALMLVNGGMPGGLDADKRPAARATSSHNTLCLAEQSSARLAREVRPGESGRSLRHLDHVTCNVREIPDGSEFEATHDGYLSRWGLIHTRTASPGICPTPSIFTCIRARRRMSLPDKAAQSWHCPMASCGASPPLGPPCRSRTARTLPIPAAHAPPNSWCCGGGVPASRRSPGSSSASAAPARGRPESPMSGFSTDWPRPARRSVATEVRSPTKKRERSFGSPVSAASSVLTPARALRARHSP